MKNEHKTIARQAIESALKNGCREARAILYQGTNSSFEVQNEHIDRLQQATETSLSIHLFADGRYGSFSTNRLEKEELERFIRNGIDAIRYLAEDPCRQLPSPKRYYRGGKPDLHLADERISTIPADEKVRIALAIAGEAYGRDPRIVSVNSCYSDGADSIYTVSSNGFEGEANATWYSVSATVGIRGEGEARPSSYWYESALFFDRLPKEGIGEKALSRALQKIGQRKTTSGKYTLIIDPLNASQLVSPLVRALYGSALQQKNSFLLDKQDKKVISEKACLWDEPHLPESAGARYFDTEGVATEGRPVFENGVLRTYFIDTYNGLKMNVPPTVGAPSLLVLKPGENDLQSLVAGTDKGILVTGFNGGNCNSSTGDFSYGIEGFLVKNGKIAQPVSEMNVTGNMLELWSNLEAVGNDPLLSSSRRIPSLMFRDVSFSGL